MQTTHTSSKISELRTNLRLKEKETLHYLSQNPNIFNQYASELKQVLPQISNLELLPIDFLIENLQVIGRDGLTKITKNLKLTNQEMVKFYLQLDKFMLSDHDLLKIKSLKLILDYFTANLLSNDLDLIFNILCSIDKELIEILMALVPCNGGMFHNMNTATSAHPFSTLNTAVASTPFGFSASIHLQQSADPRKLYLKQLLKLMKEDELPKFCVSNDSKCQNCGNRRFIVNVINRIYTECAKIESFILEFKIASNIFSSGYENDDGVNLSAAEYDRLKVGVEKLKKIGIKLCSLLNVENKWEMEVPKMVRYQVQKEPERNANQTLTYRGKLQVFVNFDLG
jgi:hypothetical protein